MISIIIPTLNEGKIIRLTLSRLKDKLSIPHEIIVSDGGSSDNTIEIAQSLAHTVVMHKEPHRQNIAEGRNAGAKVAKGEILAFMDADCSLGNPDKDFTLALENFERNPELVGQTAWIKVMKENRTIWDTIILSVMNSINTVGNILGIGMAPGELQIIRRDAFNKVCGFNEKLICTEDYNMFAKLAKIGKVRLNTNLTVYHTGRRAHKVGWPRLLWTWFSNYVSYATTSKSLTKEWTIIR